MARPHPPQDPESAALIRRIERSRERLGVHVRGAREALDVPARLKRSLQRRPLAWFGGSFGVGLVLSRLLRRPRPSKPRSSSGWGGLLGGLLLALVKPFLKGALTYALQRRLLGSGGADATETRFPLSKT